ncbi:hypothetical protein WN48_09780 [Eufriesea mexicana]|uniref:Uncharacterized protein n=1 Tax=Eufriesea mexicana TaxID=516756 RepID=A0A310SJD2_9HYME|nr:hypothetical protein WN48_09780 [Eufriesea mexicana]
MLWRYIRSGMMRRWRQVLIVLLRLLLSLLLLLLLLLLLRTLLLLLLLLLDLLLCLLHLLLLLLLLLLTRRVRKILKVKSHRWHTAMLLMRRLSHGGNVGRRSGQRRPAFCRRRRAHVARLKVPKSVLVRRTRIQFVLAVPPRVRKLADAFVVVHEVDTGATILTRVVGTVVDVGLAIGTSIASQAVATVPVQMVVASATVLTGIRAAFVDVSLTPLASVAWQTVADKLVDTVLAGAAVHARIAGTLVHVAEASSIVVAARTVAPEVVYQVYAAATVGTGVAGALVDVRFAVLTGFSSLKILNYVELANSIFPRPNVAPGVQLPETLNKGRQLVEVKRNPRRYLAIPKTLSACVTGKDEENCPPSMAVFPASGSCKTEERRQISCPSYEVSRWDLIMQTLGPGCAIERLIGRGKRFFGHMPSPRTKTDLVLECH